MVDKQEKLSNEKYDFKQAVKRVISQLKQELGEHLECINENTNEIQSNYEYIRELDQKIEKLKLRLDNVELFLSDKQGDSQSFKQDDEKIEIQPLSVNEKIIFMALYTTNLPVSYFNISEKVGLSESLVRSYITNLIEKGIPIVKTYKNGKPLIALEEKFKELQTKQNIVRIQQRQISSF